MVKFIEFPIFTGVAGELRPWISWLEAFFVREKFTADEKLNLAQSLLEGKAEVWFYRTQRMLPFQSWEDLKDDLLLRFGDVADSDRIRFIAELDRFFADAISGEQKESKKKVDLSLGKIASQLKSTPEINTEVHVSDFENLRNIEPLAENSVLANLETVVKKAKIQKNIRMDVVNGDVERIQRVMSIKKNVSAYQAFDKMSAHKERMKPQSKRKLSLSLKTWMFKFKNKIRQRNKSITRIHAELTFDVANVSTSKSNKYGTFIKTDHGERGKVQELPNQAKILKNGDVNTFGTGSTTYRLSEECNHMLLEPQKRICSEIPGYSQYRPSVMVGEAWLDVVTKPVPECNTTAAIFQLVLERFVSHDCFLGFLWKNVSWLGVVCVLAACMMHNVTVNSAKLPESLRGRELVAESRHCSAVSSNVSFMFVTWLWCHHSGLAENVHNFDIDKVQRTQMDTVAESVISRVGILVLLAQRVFQKLAAPLLKVLKSWMFKYKPQLEPTVCTFDEFSRRAFLIQWQGRDVLENSWVYSMAFVQSYHAFKLEDKLVFGEGSIDTIKQSYCRRKREESESSNGREVSSANRGFALTEYSNSSGRLKRKQKVCRWIVESSRSQINKKSRAHLCSSCDLLLMVVDELGLAMLLGRSMSISDLC